MSNNIKKRSPWAWIPTLYFAQGLPYVAVMTISVIMYKRLGMSNTDIALYTGWLGLPWVIKPFWSPFVDIIRTKRWWTLTMQWIVALAFAGIAFTIPTAFYVQFTFAIFMLMGFASATHDIAADGFYMLALTEHEQSLYVGIRSTFYRVATVVGQGLLVILAGVVEMNSGLEPVNVTVEANPALKTATAVVPSINISAADMKNDAHFVVSATDLKVAVNAPKTVATDSAKTMPFATYAKLMMDSVNNMNVRNGLVAGAVVDKSAPKAEAPKKETDGAFRAWLRSHFGDKRNVTVDGRDNNIAIVAVRLTKKPEPGKDIILSVTNNKGDQSIKLESDKLATRFVFNDKNWDKPAYLYFTIDHKITKTASASFVGASGNIPFAWMIVFITLSVFFLVVVVYHTWALPKPASDANHDDTSAKSIFKGFINTFVTFFTKLPVPQTIAAIMFMLFYRFPEAQLTKIIQPFLLDPLDKGGLALTTGEVGLVYGTVGIIGLTVGGIIGGLAAAKGGLKRWLQPMAWSMSLTCLTFIYLAFSQNQSLLSINICVFIEQFGYGFGFTAYMLYLIYYSEGKYKTAHYAICTGFMALSMMLGMIAGWLQETIGYENFFIWTMICCLCTIGVSMIVKVDPKFGLKESEKNEEVATKDDKK
jgi:MFS transporter, PAT family, beta-lactamase induction signal transducer AmpG